MKRKIMEKWATKGEARGRSSKECVDGGKEQVEKDEEKHLKLHYTSYHHYYVIIVLSSLVLHK